MNMSTIKRRSALSIPSSRAAQIAQASGAPSRGSRVRRALAGLFAAPIVGNPLHEAWTADGEPLERVSPDAMAKSRASRHLIVPHNRGR
jgi:hypothetical protein